MEREWSLFTTGTTPTTHNNREAGGQNGHVINPAWDHSHHQFDWTNRTAPATATAASELHALMMDQRAASLYAGSQYHPDPHLTCLKLGKRQYFGGGAAAVVGEEEEEENLFGKRGRGFNGECRGDMGVTVASTPVVPRCQVEGCEVVLVEAKEYHRRHKVCEMHSKAPKVVVRGAEKRFCQQCSRFHSVSEFDDSKRSCRRRLAGHNERRRKGSHDPISSHPSQGRALSLLSTKNDNSWFPSSDLSSRCSAALRELIAENRASIMAARQVEDLSCCNFAAGPSSSSQIYFPHYSQVHDPEQHRWGRYNGGGDSGGGGGHVTLDLMQAPTSAFGYMSVRETSDEEEQCSDQMWSSFGGSTHVM